jgi:hypothetical protein
VAQYDESVLQQYADGLYSKAQWITLKCGLAGTLIGVLLAVAPAVIVRNRIADARAQAIIEHYRGSGNGFDVPPPPPQDSVQQNTPLLLLVLGAGFGALVGIPAGRRKAFEYRLQAQLALCQMQVERNTRNSSQ